jgi:hypothetical protein
MRIYGKIPDGRLKDVVSFDDAFVEGSYLLVVHPNNIKDWVNQDIGKRLQDVHCRGLLLVKGVPRAGLTGEEFARLKKQYGDRFHASACTVGTAQENTRLSGELETRFKNFFRHARGSDDKLDWTILDPQWPDYLVSAYLLAKAMMAGTKEADLIESQAEDWQSIWEGAKKEHELLTGNPLTQRQLDKSTAGDVAEQIGQYLQTVAARVA